MAPSASVFLRAIVQAFETGPFFSFHHCNAFEHGKYITVDTVAWDELSFTGFNVDSLSAAYYRCGDLRPSGNKHQDRSPR